MAETKTLYAMLDLLKLNAKDGLWISDFTTIGHIDYNSAKKTLQFLQDAGIVISDGKKWKLKN